MPPGSGHVTSTMRSLLSARDCKHVTDHRWRTCPNNSAALSPKAMTLAPVADFICRGWVGLSRSRGCFVLISRKAEQQR